MRLKSLRRYLFTRYIRPQHRDCYTHLLQCSRQASQSLNANQVCSVSLAFLAWRMAFEDMTNIEHLRSPNHADFYCLPVAWLYCLHFPPLRRTTCNVLLGAFYSLWARIEGHCDCRSFYIESLDNCYTKEWLFHTFAESQVPSLPENVRQWWLLYPDPTALVQQALARCSRRGKLSQMQHADLL